jgi:murein DD-endopeptidase MepM/ murein hydrolase activator NlpD
MATTSLDIGNGAYAFYAHLIKASLLVKPGDKVTKGQPIAKLGNTGNANASHLHFQIMNGPSAIASPGTPYLIDSFDYQGQISPQASTTPTTTSPAPSSTQTIAHHPKPAPTSYPWPGRSSPPTMRIFESR